MCGCTHTKKLGNPHHIFKISIIFYSLMLTIVIFKPNNIHFKQSN